MASKRIKLSQFAIQQGISYRSAHRQWTSGRIKGIQLATGTILVDGWEEPSADNENDKVAVIYARVSSLAKPGELRAQSKKLEAFAAESGYQVAETVEEVSTGFSDSRPKFMSLLQRTDWNVLIVESDENAMKFGFPYLETLLEQTGRYVVARKSAEEEDEQSKRPSGDLVLQELSRRTDGLLRSLVAVGNVKGDITRLLRNLHS